VSFAEVMAGAPGFRKAADPDAAEVIRLQGAAFRDAVLGSDMSYEDLTGGKTLLETYRVSLEGTETVDGAECYRIRMEAKARNVAYPVQVMWVDAKLWSARRIQQFSLAGRLLKEIGIGSFETVAGRTVATRMVLEDKLKKNSRTVFLVEKIEVDIPLDPKLFSLEQHWLLSLGGMDSFGYLFISAIAIAASRPRLGCDSAFSAVR
jgi:hypothetical protein